MPTSSSRPARWLRRSHCSPPTRPQHPFAGTSWTDGPFIDADEVVAGFYVIEAADLDAAVEIARRNPITQQGGGVEVRPVEGAFIADRPANG